MLKTLFSTYKLYFLAFIFVAWSGALWHVSSTYTASKYIGKQLDVALATNKAVEDNRITAAVIAKVMEDKLAALKPQTTVINRNITNEIAKDTVYLDCKSNPNVMREYQRKLDLQPK
jgi:hypothetical protein